MSKFFFLIFLLFLWFTSGAQGASRQPFIEGKLPTVVPVYCASDYSEWKEITKGFPAMVSGFTWAAGPQAWSVYLSPLICTALNTPKHDYFEEAWGIALHEWIHSVFHLKDEGETECLSLYIYRFTLIRDWGFSRKAAERAYRQARAAHAQRAFAYPAYAGNC